MDTNRGDRRAETARLNDDSDIIEAAEDERLTGAHQQGSGGGSLQTDLGTKVDEERATDPNRHESVKKDDHIAHGQGERPPPPATEVVNDEG